jgi:hypothetical protein
MCQDRDENAHGRQYYTADRKTGREPLLMDGCTGGQSTCSCQHTGNTNVGNFVACILNASAPVTSIKVRVVIRVLFAHSLLLAAGQIRINGV